MLVVEKWQQKHTQRQSAAQNRKCVEKQDMKRRCWCWWAPEKGGETKRRNEAEIERESMDERKRKYKLINTNTKISFKYRHAEIQAFPCVSTVGRLVSARLPLLTVRLRDSPFTQLLQHIKDFLRLLGETVLTQLLQLSVITERQNETRKEGRLTRKLQLFQWKYFRVGLQLTIILNID